MLSSVSSANSLNVSALNTASLLAQVREARKASLATQGIRAFDPATNAVDPTYVKALYKDYVQFFLGDTNAKKVGLVKIEELLNSGFVDRFRYMHPNETGRYSWWSYRFNARKNNAGWRIDYFIISDRIKDKIINADILSEVYGSDHCPVLLEIDI